jgi:hypothetical protein
MEVTWQKYLNIDDLPSHWKEIPVFTDDKV